MIRDATGRALRWAKRILRKIAGRRTSAEPKTVHTIGDWKREAQEGEFFFHLKDQWRQTPDFMDQTRRLFGHFGFSPDAYVGKRIIDLGAGSKLRTKYFVGAKIVAIEPLADRFMKEIPWCDLAEADRVHSKPAEERVAECVAAADLVVSVNVLDHCYDFEGIVENIEAYLKADGLAFLSFDQHDEADEMHPLRLTGEICERIFALKGLAVEKRSKGAGEILQTYGHGDYCLNYWLRKAG
jgi:2-polyprenyl-3-methyl-5-hydroxy-6-metoxy-1,4-benzoquinol methylase